MTTTSLTEISTHDLWVEARQFDLDISRPTADTIKLVIKRPANLMVVDGAVLTISTKALTPAGYPQDGTKYIGSLIYGDVGANSIADSQVLAFWSAILNQPFPSSTAVADDKVEFSVTVTDTDPDTIYYASIHPVSNVLQYYPIGIQSYPLEASRVEKDSSSYTGSIPTLPSAPTSPTPGMVYHDQQLNIIQYWDASRSIWIPTRTDAILSGAVNPGLPGQTYLLTGSVLKVFNGTNWVQATSANLQLKVGMSWVPLGVISSLTQLPTSPAVGDLVYEFTSRRVQYWDGASWQIPSSSTSLLDTGSGLIPAFTTPFSLEPTDLITPYLGLLFYNTTAHILNVWNGTSWQQANTSQQGTAITDKIGIGNDGSYDERLRLINILKGQLGWPATCVELTEEQFNIAIDNAVDTYRQLSIGGYEQRFMIFELLKDQSVYYLNSPVNYTDAIVSVMKIHRLNLFGMTGSGPDNTWGQAFAQQFYNFAAGGTELLSVHLTHQWAEEFTKIFAGDLPFIWNEARRELTLKRAIRANEKVVLEIEIERSEQELLLDRWCKQWLQAWARAECLEMLGMIRSRYSSGTPGPAGTITQNGELLISEARQEFTDLREQLFNNESQNAEHGNLAFMWG